MANVYDGVIYGAYSKYTRLRLNYTVSQDEVTAISTITMNLYAERTKGSSQYNNTGQSYWSMTGTGNNYMNFNWASNSLELHLGSSSIQVQHNDDGNASVTLSGYWYTGRTSSSYIPAEISVSETITLKNIPRKSSISMSTANIESNATVTISGYSDSFRHSVYCYFGNQYEVIATNQPRGSFLWRIPTSFYAQIPSAKTGKGTIMCETYSGGTLIGTTSNEFWVTTNEELCRPSVSGTLIDSNPITVDLTKNSNKLIRYRSTAYITTNAQPKNSASIKRITIQGVEVSNNEIWFENVDANQFEVIATDTREYTGKDTLTAEMIPYIPLSLSATFFRPLPTTGEVSVTYSGNYFNGQFSETEPNTLDITWYYREKVSSGEENEWIEGGKITPTIEENKIVKETVSLGKEYDYQKEYDFKVTAKDKLTEVVRNASVSMGIPVYNWGKDFFNVNTRATFKEDVHGRNLPIATTVVESTSYNDVGIGQQLYKSGFYTINQDGWNYLINVRHRNGAGDGINYGMQIKMPFDGGETTQLRVQHAGNWDEWQNIYKGRVIFENLSGETGIVHLTDSADHYKWLEIQYKDVDGVYGHARAFANVTSSMNTYTYYGHLNQAFLKGNAITVSGLSIYRVTSWEVAANTGSAYLGQNIDADSVRFRIFRVIGYR